MRKKRGQSVPAWNPRGVFQEDRSSPRISPLIVSRNKLQREQKLGNHVFQAGGLIGAKSQGTWIRGGGRGNAESVEGSMRTPRTYKRDRAVPGNVFFSYATPFFISRMWFSGIVALCALGLVSSAKLPASFPQCKRSDPKIDECLKNAIQVSFPQMADGLSSLGIYPLDPLEIPAVDIAQGGGPVSIDIKFRDLKIKGLKDVKVDKVESDLDKYKIKITAIMDKPLFLDGKYEAKGNVLVLPIAGNGDAHLRLDDVKAYLTLEGKELKKNGKSYMDLEKFDFDYDTSKLNMNFEHLLSQDKALADNLNTFLNENWKEIHGELKPAVKEAFGAAFKAIASRIMSRVPYDDIFLP